VASERVFSTAITAYRSAAVATEVAMATKPSEKIAVFNEEILQVM
jgi:hypothetical protein